MCRNPWKGIKGNCSSAGQSWAILVVAAYGVLTDVIWRTVTHHSAVVLGEDPAVTLSIVAYLSDKSILRLVELRKTFGQEMRDGDGAGRGLCLDKFAGLVWTQHQSGNFEAQDTRLIKSGNRFLRCYLLEAANSVRRCDSEFRRYYDLKYKEVNKYQHTLLCCRVQCFD